MQKIDIKVNKSKIYFLPLFNLELEVNYLDLLKTTYFWYESQKEETFCLLYQFDGRIEGTHRGRTGFTIYEENVLFKHKLFRGYQDYGEYVIYEFGLTPELAGYRDILLEGRYSLLPEQAKQVILKFITRVWGPADREFIEKVLYKNAGLLRELADEFGVDLQYVTEAASIIDPERELFSNHLI